MQNSFRVTSRVLPLLAVLISPGGGLGYILAGRMTFRQSLYPFVLVHLSIGLCLPVKECMCMKLNTVFFRPARLEEEVVLGA